MVDYKNDDYMNFHLLKFSKRFNIKIDNFTINTTELKCMGCGVTDNVNLENSRSCSSPEPIPLCDICAKEHHENMDDLWSEYYRSQY